MSVMKQASVVNIDAKNAMHRDSSSPQPLLSLTEVNDLFSADSDMLIQDTYVQESITGFLPELERD
jgi:hypothetical protein